MQARYVVFAFLVWVCCFNAPRAFADASPQFHVVATPQQTVTGTLTYTLTGPVLKATEWLAFMPEAPTYNGQTNPSTSLSITNLPGATVSEVIDQSAQHRPALRARVKIANPIVPSSVTVQVVYKATLLKRDLVAGAPSTPVPALSATDRQNYLSQSYTIDYQSAAFQQWLTSNSLIKQNQETELDFGRRALQFLAVHYTYQYIPTQDHRVSSLCSTNTTDCGGASDLFVAIMRASGIPSRLLVGRWAISSTSSADVHQWHVKSEFFATGIGWVPIEASNALGASNIDVYFGHDDGMLLVFHLDGDLLYDPLYWPVYNSQLMQNPGCWATGSGSFDGNTTIDSWVVSSASPTPIITSEAVAVASAPAGSTRLLWDKNDGAATVWNIGSGGALTYGPVYGPFAGWTARALAATADGTSHLLWTNTSGQATVWTLNASGTATAYGPTFGPFAGWTAQSIATAPDGTSRLLWTNTNGQATLWTLNASGSATSYGAVYGPYAGWTAQSAAVDNNGSARLLWTNTDGRMTVWTLPATGSPTYGAVYGPIAGWTAKTVAAGTDGLSRVLWNKGDGSAVVWALSAAGVVSSYGTTYGPYAGWGALSLSVDTSSLTHLLWANTDGHASVWTATAGGTVQSYGTAYGPF